MMRKTEKRMPFFYDNDEDAVKVNPYKEKMITADLLLSTLLLKRKNRYIDYTRNR